MGWRRVTPTDGGGTLQGMTEISIGEYSSSGLFNRKVGNGAFLFTHQPLDSSGGTSWIWEMLVSR